MLGNYSDSTLSTVVFLKMNFAILIADRKATSVLNECFYEFSTATLRSERKRVCNRICKFIWGYFCKIKVR